MVEVEALAVVRYFSREGEDPYESVTWVKSDARVTEGEKVKFEQKDVLFPEDFSRLAISIVASKYFYGELETDEREYSFKQLVHRISSTIAKQGQKQGQFNEQEARIFQDEFATLYLKQYTACNSPVQFNVGIGIYESSKSSKSRDGWVISDRDQTITLETKLGLAKFDIKKGEAIPIPEGEQHLWPQTSACFIQSLEDTMEDIMRLAVSEAMLFKHGSGTGTDLSTLRSSREKLSGGGKPSGPLAYGKHYDRIAAVVQSGGKTRRAAKMNSLLITHPDIKEFILAKQNEEGKVKMLIGGGLDPSEARETVAYQNVNFSVRMTDEFMRAYENDEQWQTIPVHNLEMADEMPQYGARDLMHWIAEATHICGDPGIQYDTTINKWHTCPNSALIRASNPCSEYMFIDDSSCNLASHNLVKFLMSDGSFDIEGFIRAIDITAIAQDTLYEMSSFPEKKIAENSRNYRPLGMGFANLGSFIMRCGLAYDSDEARILTSAITSLMTATAYETSAKMAKRIGAFAKFEENREPMLNVLEMHKDASYKIDSSKLLDIHKNIKEEANKRWESALELGSQYGFRNAQTTVLAPTGTIAFMLDCDTTGIEPDTALVKYKKLSGGGLLKIVNQSVGPALNKLGYTVDQIEDIDNYLIGNRNSEGRPTVEDCKFVDPKHYLEINKSKDKGETLKRLGYADWQIDKILCYMDGYDTIENAPHIKEEHLKVFDCSLKPHKGNRNIEYMGHLKMMASVQPFISGAISKTINMDASVTVEDIENAYVQAHKLGLKSVAIYRDGTKADQPVRTKEQKGKAGGLEKAVQWNHEPIRRRLPETRKSITHKFEVAGHEGYFTVGLYGDGSPGELFITMAKEGSTVGGLMDVIGTCFSMSLQYGVPIQALTNKFRGSRFEPSGMTASKHKDLKFAKSLMDYISKWLHIEFVGDLPGSEKKPAPNGEEIQQNNRPKENHGNSKNPTIILDEDPTNIINGKSCANCGNTMDPKCGAICPTCNTPNYTGCDGS